jgi:hypothetical protein
MLMDCILIMEKQPVGLRGAAAAPLTLRHRPRHLLPPNRPAAGILATHCVDQSQNASALSEVRPTGLKSRRDPQFVRRAKMVSTDGRDGQERAALTVSREANKRANKGANKDTKKAAAPRPSPAEKFDVDRDEPAIRAGKLQVQAQRAQKLHEYYDEALAEIRASLERAPRR